MPSSSDLTRRAALERGAAGVLLLAAGCGGGDGTAPPPELPRLRAARPGKDGARTRPPMSLWGELRHEVRGRVERPASSAALVYNQRFAGVRPAAVVRVRDEADVQAVVRWASRHDVPLRVRAGGHSYEGYSTGAGAVVIDLAGLRGVAVGARRVRVGAGAQLIDVHARLARAGGMLPTASCPSVGIGGSTLGGGMGFGGRALGLTCDRVRAVRLVTPDGRLVRATARTEPDLLWACRGGGGSFGVVTAFELAPHAARGGSWFSISWPSSAAEAAFDAWQRFAPHAPDALTSQFSLSPGGAVACEGQYLGPSGRLPRLLAPLTGAGGGALSTGAASTLALARRWARCGARSLAACHAGGLSPAGTLPRIGFDNGSAFFARPLGARGRAALLGAARSPGAGGMLLDSWGGAIARVGADETAFAHRRALFNVQLLTDGSPAATAWKRRTLAALRPYAAGAYLNYVDRDEPDSAHAYYGANLEKLRAIKARVDPERVLDLPQGV